MNYSKREKRQEKLTKQVWMRPFFSRVKLQKEKFNEPPFRRILYSQPSSPACPSARWPTDASRGSSACCWAPSGFSSARWCWPGASAGSPATYRGTEGGQRREGLRSGQRRFPFEENCELGGVHLRRRWDGIANTCVHRRTFKCSAVARGGKRHSRCWSLHGKKLKLNKGSSCIKASIKNEHQQIMKTFICSIHSSWVLAFTLVFKGANQLCKWCNLPPVWKRSCLSSSSVNMSL